ncbi:MAG: hypothetical protein P1U89_06210 [Verrucomicrobiales bacterium]|nr:hypothetical protein [Verrucomicrobiales bacterium]
MKLPISQVLTISFALLHILSSCEKQSKDDAVTTITYLISVNPIGSAQQFDLTREGFKEKGISFPDGSALISGLGISGFAMRNTELNHEKLQRWLNVEFPGKWRIQEEPIPVIMPDG